ncbi:hypothetical protein C8Q77DRAFT_1074976 [Trametes polyzona]|nr:hypothetical protein C8Q77DRAFT_1074976 [Trametes polyzona]
MERSIQDTEFTFPDAWDFNPPAHSGNAPLESYSPFTLDSADFSWDGSSFPDVRGSAAYAPGGSHSSYTDDWIYAQGAYDRPTDALQQPFPPPTSFASDDTSVYATPPLQGRYGDRTAAGKQPETGPMQTQLSSDYSTSPTALSAFCQQPQPYPGSQESSSTAHSSATAHRSMDLPDRAGSQSNAKATASQKRRTQDASRTHICPECSTAFTRKYNLEVHVATKHEHRRDFACWAENCTMAFGRKHDLTRHFQSMHTNLGSPRRKPPTSRRTDSRTLDAYPLSGRVPATRGQRYARSPLALEYGFVEGGRLVGEKRPRSSGRPLPTPTGHQHGHKAYTDKMLDRALDICDLVCGAVEDIPTILSLSLVSQSLRSTATRQLLLRKTPVVVRDERSACSFHSFLFADIAARVGLVRALVIAHADRYQPYPPHAVACILDILTIATHLQSFTLAAPYRAFEESDSQRLSAAIAGLSTLRELALLTDWGQATETILRTTRSTPHLRILRVDLSSYVSDQRQISTADLDAVLGDFHQSLEALEIGTDERALVLDTTGLVYPSVRSLTADFLLGPWRTDVLVSKFPALDRTLDLSPGLGDALLPTEEKEEARALNIARQRDRTWRSLDRVEGCVFLLYVFAIQCPIRHLMLNEVHSYEDAHLRAILGTAPPTHLKLTKEMDFGDNFSPDVFREEVIPRLTHLALVLRYDNPWRSWEAPDRAAQANWGQELFASIIAAVKKLELTHLRLCIHYNLSITGPPEAPVVPAEPFILALIRLRHEDFAAQLMEAAPTLRRVFITVSGRMRGSGRNLPPAQPPQDGSPWWPHGPWLEPSGWSRAEPNGEITKLDRKTMEQIIKDEDLMLTDLDYFKFGLGPTPWNGAPVLPPDMAT